MTTNGKMKRLNEGKTKLKKWNGEIRKILREGYSYQTSQNKDYAEIKN